MPDIYRLTVRLAPALVAELEQHIRPRESLSDVVRRALEAFVAAPSAMTATTDTPARADTPERTAALEEIREQFAVLAEAVQQLQQREPTVLPRQTRHPPRQPGQPPVLRPGRYLGKLCPRGHDYQETGQSLRLDTSHSCIPCNLLATRAVREQKRARGG